MNWRCEYKKCLIDTTRKYMIENYVFKKPLWEIQNELLDFINNKKKTIVTKSRDVGFTDIMAAYVACELVLNSDGINDENFIVYYCTPTNMLGNVFYNKVLQYIKKIPYELYTCESFGIGQTPKEIEIGKSILKIVDKDTISKSLISCNLIIADEIVTGMVNNNFHTGNLIAMSKFFGTNKTIIGSVPNHKNTEWFNIIKEAKEEGNYFVMPWWSNPKHKFDASDEKMPIITSNGEIEYYNKWYSNRKHLYHDEDSFNEEVCCQVWREKVVKEYI